MAVAIALTSPPHRLNVSLLEGRVGSSIREVERLRRACGAGRWRKLKGIATISLDDSSTGRAELHWYEAHGVGKKEFKIKRFLD